MFRNPLSTGVDIGSHSIKAVVLLQQKEQLKLVSFTEVVLSNSVTNDQHIVNSAELILAMRQLKKQLPWNAKKITLALPDSAVISKVIDLTQDLSENELEAAIIQSLVSTSSHLIEDLYFDYFPLSNVGHAEGIAKHQYHVFASRKETIDSRVSVLKKLGFTAKVMELQTNALLWLAEYLADHRRDYRPWGLVDIGKQRTEFCIKQWDGNAYHREIPFSAKQFDVLSLESSGLENKIEIFTYQLAEQLKRQIQLYSSTYPNDAIEGFWLCGGCENLISVSLLQQLLCLDVAWVDPFRGVDCDSDIILSQQRLSKYALATGLALRGIDES